MHQSQKRFSKSVTDTKYFTNLASGLGAGSSSTINPTVRPATAGNSRTRTGPLDLDFIKMINPHMANINKNNTSTNPLEYDHPPLPSEPAGLYDTLITDADMAFMKKKFVKVTSSGQVVRIIKIVTDFQ